MLSERRFKYKDTKKDGQGCLTTFLPKKVFNPAYETISCEPLEVAIRSQIGTVLPPEDLAQLPELIDGLCADPGAWLRRNTPDAPVFFFRPATLQATAQRFLRGFPGAVTYAVKANPAPCVLDNLVAAGLRTFDVASVPEMQAVRAACPDAALHFHNPVRSRAEIAEGLRLGVQSWSVDRLSELDKLAALPPGSEIAVRLKLPVPGAAYDFGAKFGAEPEAAAALLAKLGEDIA